MKTQAELAKFMTKDVSQIQDNRNEGTIYAIDLDNAPEVNVIDKVFLVRDQRVERKEIPIILPEEEFKKYKTAPGDKGPVFPGRTDIGARPGAIRPYVNRTAGLEGNRQ